jgi:hypothetical protein
MAREKREVWVKRVERVAESGLTANEFAAEIGVGAFTCARQRHVHFEDGHPIS